ncbi:MAG: XdhC/CoxI family protein [Anaerovoracaceae bacterium]|nr:dehydrogenase [Clostridiales bacterium]
MKKKATDFVKDLVREDKAFVIAEITDTLGSSPGKRGAFLVMARDGSCAGTVGGGALEGLIQKMALDFFDRSEPHVEEFTLTEDESKGLDMQCGGTAFVHFQYYPHDKGEDFLNSFRLNFTSYIFGCGHIGRSLEPLLRYVSFDTVMVDDREEYADKELFPLSKDVILIPSFEDSFSQITTCKTSFIVIVTRGHQGDYEVLKQALKRDHAYIGMIGSKSKVKGIYDRLLKDGFTQEELDKVHSPIGLPIGGKSPEEIAVSITAEMIKIRSLMEDL